MSRPSFIGILLLTCGLLLLAGLVSKRLADIHADTTIEGRSGV